jgi:hypothetical protein
MLVGSGLLKVWFLCYFPSFALRARPIAMKKYFVPLLLCTAVFVFGIGCSSPYVAQKPPPSAYRPVSHESPTKKVEIVSEPAGARIEVNDNYVGDAPITVEIPQWVGQFTIQ